MDDRRPAISRRAAMTGLGASAGALVFADRVAAGASPADTAGVVPFAPVRNAAGPEGLDLIGRSFHRVAAADFRTFDAAASALSPGALTASAGTTATASFPPRAGDVLSSVTVHLNPGGAARAIRVSRERLDGSVEILASGTSPSGSSVVEARLDLPPGTVADTQAGEAFTVSVDVGAGTVVHGALVVAFTRATEFVLVDPFRVWDSRTPRGSLINPNATAGGRLASGQTRVFSVDGRITRYCSGLLLNVTLAETVGAGYLTFYGADPRDPTPPPVSSINWYAADQIVANLVVTRMAEEAVVTVGCGGGGTTHYVVDCLGYFV